MTRRVPHWRRVLPASTASGRAIAGARRDRYPLQELAAFVVIVVLLLAGAVMAEPSSPPAEGWRIEEAPGRVP